MRKKKDDDKMKDRKEKQAVKESKHAKDIESLQDALKEDFKTEYTQKRKKVQLRVNRSG